MTLTIKYGLMFNEANIIINNEKDTLLERGLYQLFIKISLKQYIIVGQVAYIATFHTIGYIN
jgi:hypothetical protein